MKTKYLPTPEEIQKVVGDPLKIKIGSGYILSFQAGWQANAENKKLHQLIHERNTQFAMSKIQCQIDGNGLIFHCYIDVIIDGAVLKMRFDEYSHETKGHGKPNYETFIIMPKTAGTEDAIYTQNVNLPIIELDVKA